MVVFIRKGDNMTYKKPQQLGPIERRKEAIQNYITVRKAKSQEIRDYFASEGESDPARLAAQQERDKEFIQSLKKVGVAAAAFTIFYLILRTILGLW